MLPRPHSSGAAEPSRFDPLPIGAGSPAAVVALVAVLTIIRLWVAGTIGLSADETYYWIWSKSLAFGYLDHPPLVAVLIRASTAVFGDTPFGIRWLSVLLGAAASLGAWRFVLQLSGDRRAALAAAGLIQATLFIGVGTMLVTPDTPLVLFWMLALLALGQVLVTGRGAWWLAVGLAVGLAFISKYTTVFLGLGILIWLVLVPELRRWFVSPWPYAGGVVCLLVIAPVVTWNLLHGGASLTKQFGRAVPHAFDPRFVPEFIAGQAALLTPLIGILVLVGLVVATQRTWMRRDAAAGLVVATTLPLVVYLVWYGLFDRVQGNWTACLLPATMAAAVMGATPRQGALGALVRVSMRYAVVTGVAIGLFVMAHAQWRILPLNPDPTSQLFGWRAAVAAVEQVAADKGAATIGTGSYTMSGEFRFHGQGGLPVVQLNERLRFAMEPEPDIARLRARPILVVAEIRRDREMFDALKRSFRSVERVGSVERSWRAPLLSPSASAVVDKLSLFLVADPVGEGFPDIGSLY
jgi:4-amino-4-deoxy-L-arabinose transferase-like glycosyltransferase